ncbi:MULTISPECIES: glycosyltransferase [unclassified Tolypothrix]|uniref:glycosyltransferase n=1 Tax=unclassified Tolypothrix TaxID=2649714 RepID=UPI0005F76FE7|nr:MULTISPECIES: glycosyltransferase [unclassified Tolypothrix]MBE9081747.1 glycosyltransferase [Tolypothrix sp. LEGE 11397]UYD26035.1 glycosyltransferase [Tolypothrix sp. PCC 7712]UYD31726.1 glycosyltransferase [Tolypothrix sp. PCC 7601]
MRTQAKLTATAKFFTHTQSSCIVFMSSCYEPWGGSEELWSATAKYLQRQGNQTYVFKINVDKTHSRVAELEQAGIVIIDTLVLQRNSRRIVNRILGRLGRVQIVKQVRQRLGHLHLFLNPCLPGQWRSTNTSRLSPLARQLGQLQPTLVVISQGENFDGLAFAELCQQMKLPYVILSEKAGEDRWPGDHLRPLMRKAFQEAKKCFFVSQHNLCLTQMQVSQKLSHAEVIRNPYLTPVASALPWKHPEDGCFKLACVARLWLFDKGQDILLQVLAQKKWRQRNLHITFFGEGANREGLIEMADFLGVKNVSFPGFVENIVEVWRNFHGLILPSRAEGLPIALVEAMMCGRLGIVTNVGGVSEVVTNNITGFVAQEPSCQAIDEVLERAWQRRYEWEQIGHKAAQSIREIIPPDPDGVFAHKLLQLCQTSENVSEIDAVSLSKFSSMSL